MIGGECKFGAQLVTMTHRAGATKTATQWAGNPTDARVSVERHICRGCGREQARIFRDGKLIHVWS